MEPVVAPFVPSVENPGAIRGGFRWHFCPKNSPRGMRSWCIFPLRKSHFVSLAGSCCDKGRPDAFGWVGARGLGITERLWRSFAMAYGWDLQVAQRRQTVMLSHVFPFSLGSFSQSRPLLGGCSSVDILWHISMQGISLHQRCCGWPAPMPLACPPLQGCHWANCSHA